jgi:nitroreductase/dihydropteridine reductase
MALVETLQWRYATKKMNGQAVPQEKLDYILEAARLAPSSAGLQPYKVFVISNKELLEKVKEISHNQSQITDCSHLLVFAAWDGYTPERIDNVLSQIARERNMPLSALDDFKEKIWGSFGPLDQDWHSNHSAKQAYIAFGLAIAAAAEQKVDATPMEGFIPAKMDELLGLDKLGLKSVVILPLGYRADEGDWLMNLKKVRTPREEFVTEIV